MVLQDEERPRLATSGGNPLNLGYADETPQVVLSALERVALAAISHRRISSGVEMERFGERGERAIVCPLYRPGGCGHV